MAKKKRVKKLRWLRKFRLVATPVLAVLAILAYAAGTDIFHGTEPNLSAEWDIFALFFYLTCGYILLNLIEMVLDRD